MTAGDCLNCEHTRCMDCDVHRGSAPDVEDKGKLKAVGEEETGMMAMHQTRSGQGEASSAGFHENPQRQVPYPESRMEEMGMEQPWLIEIASRTENHSIYILRQDEDASLILRWNRYLGTLSEECKSACQTLVSIHLFRMGLNEPSSTPTVLINTSKPISRGEQHKLQIGISRCLISFIGGQETYGRSNLSRILPSCQLVFRESRLRRSMDNTSEVLPPICQPRNRTFSKSPCTGSSVGIAHSDKDTATLGCFVRVGGKTMGLTVDHLIPPRSVDPAITHISEQDRVALLFPTIQSEFDFELELAPVTSGHRCFRCTSFRHKWIDECGDLSWLFSDSEQSCPLVRKANEILTRAQEEFGAQALFLGKKHSKSGRRFGIVRFSNLAPLPFLQVLPRREMDWALFETDCANPIFDLKIPMSFTDSPTELQPRTLKPGAFVRSIGRTSGHSTGQISNTMSTIFHGEYETAEWCVLKRDKTDIHEWIQGSMGVDGDSGALIVDNAISDLYGMLWGRIGDGPATVTLFTPINDILSDIEEQTKSECYFIPGQEMQRPS
jgi:hypothetical protein